MGLMDFLSRKARQKVDAHLGLDLDCDHEGCDRRADGTYVVRHEDEQVCASGMICTPHAMDIYVAATAPGARVRCTMHGLDATMEARGDFRP